MSGISASVPDRPIAGPGDMQIQAGQVPYNIKDADVATGAKFEDIVRMTIYGGRTASLVISELYNSHPQATLIELSWVANPEPVFDIETTVDLD